MACESVAPLVRRSCRRSTPWSVVFAGSAAVIGAGLPAAAAPDRDDSFEVAGVEGELADRIAVHAAGVRRAISSQLLGITDPPVWRPRCIIQVHGSSASFRTAVRGAPAAARGATSIEFVHDAVSLRRIDLMGEQTPGAIPDALGHELVHVVLADHFIDGPPPPWADEGLAMLFDTPEKQSAHEADFLAAAARGQAWRVRDLMALEVHPAEAGRQRVFYGQSGALVRWFLERGDAATFLEFLADAAEVGTGRALRDRYGIASADEIDRQWGHGQSLPPRSRDGLVGR